MADSVGPISATVWASEQVIQLGVRLTGEFALEHQRPWSTVWRAAAKNGELILKAVSARAAFEAAATAALAAWFPDQAPRLLAVEPARGWLLMQAETVRLREVIRAERDLRHWQRLLPRYAELQIALAQHIPALLAMGVPDRRPVALPTLYAELLDDAVALRLHHPEGISPETLVKLRALAPRVEQMCQMAAGDGVPVSLNHGDFHDGNIFLRGDSYVYIDWGDAVVSHPFFSFRTACVSLEMSLGLDENPPECDVLRAAYLEPWQRFLPAARQEEAFENAYRLSILNGALTWRSALAGLSAAERAAAAHAVPALLEEFLARID